MSAISYFHKIRGFFDPTHAYPIQEMLKAIRKLRPSVDFRKPITEHILVNITEKMYSLCPISYEYYLFKSMFLVASYFGLRVGEITNSKHNIHMTDVIIAGKSYN